mmetsp:Transcript_28809/g.37851  ORF Transcript_28809/g.37851 Transcript_28809/m.37851 type:complete len:437 (+) Transcript_28809:148-1458(+)|eukprot:CAMPEP_0117755292 /NCGR_PEP_ID=MMETSP0947-20121206/13363_1 /TAXON_ID=44440 /ORGANISM="Chattonella subsalsa, Strain CCMP2191" /LENGTH=436 /DNA_ID=CAMNT_0005574595 /DNA_START=66 /DNA_END=1376 /DNA_ORIENTATION=-
MDQNIRATSNKKYDIIVWGATGFTGNLVAKYFLETYGPPNEKLNWAVGGRSSQKLQALRNDLSKINQSALEIPTVIADSNEKNTLLEMAGQTKVVLTTVGPFSKYGTELVEACIEKGTHYCDITGEPLFIQKNIQRYHSFAQSKGVKIVHCCGFDSLPSDLGVFLLAEHAHKSFNTELMQATTYVTDIKGGASGGTVASVINAFEEAWKLGIKRTSKLLGPYALNPEDNIPAHKESDGGFGYSSDIKRWHSPFIMASINAKVVRRSNALLENMYGSNFHYKEVMAAQKGLVIGFFVNLFSSIGLGIGAAFLFFPWTRALIKRCVPRPGTGPSHISRESGNFEFMLVGKLSKSSKDIQSREIRAIVKSDVGDPGYKETSKMLAESALCLALDLEKCTNLAGILTPASAMGMALVNRLRNADMVLKVIDKKHGDGTCK